MLEPAELIALADGGIARKDSCARLARLQHEIEKMQADARDQHRRNRDQGDGFAGLQTAADDRTLVLAKQTLDALQRDRVDVPAIAEDGSHLLDPAIMRRVKAVIH